MEVFAKELTKGRHLFPARAYAVLLETLLKRYVLKEFVKSFLRLQPINITHKIVRPTIELAKGLTVIRVFKRDRASLSLSEIARSAGMPAATARRCLLTLEELGYVTRSGRDFVLTLQRLWQAHGCLTTARSRALSAHLAALTATPRARRRPGSYAWPELRRRLEARFAGGLSPSAATAQVTRAFSAGHPLARPPSTRTVQRWHADARWLTSPSPP